MCCIFWPGFGCCALQTLVELVIFSGFFVQKKQEICSQILPKTHFFKFAPKRWLTVLFPKKLAFSLHQRKKVFQSILTPLYIKEMTLHHFIYTISHRKQVHQDRSPHEHHIHHVCTIFVETSRRFFLQKINNLEFFWT